MVMEFSSHSSSEKQLKKSRGLYFCMKNNVIVLCKKMFLNDGLHQQNNYLRVNVKNCYWETLALINGMTKKLNRKLRNLYNSSWKQGCTESNREIIVTEARLSGGANRRNVAKLRYEEPNCRIEELSFWLFVIIVSCPVKWT